MLTIHGVPISVHTRKVLVTAIEKQLQFRNEPVIPFQPPTGWSDLSPTGKIPVVTDGDLVLRDSSVICAYLERTHPTPALYPARTRDYAEALWFEEYADGIVFREVVHGLFVQKIIRPNILKQESDSSAIDAILTKALPQVFGFWRMRSTATSSPPASSPSQTLHWSRISSTFTISATRSTIAIRSFAPTSRSTSGGRRSGRRCSPRSRSLPQWVSMLRSSARPQRRPPDWPRASRTPVRQGEPASLRHSVAGNRPLRV